MSRSCHNVTFSSAGITALRTTRARPVRFSVSTGLRLCGIEELPFCPGEKQLLGLAHFGALQVADLGREIFDRGGDDGQRCEEGGVAVARDDLRRDRLDRQPELARNVFLDRGSTLAKVPTGPRWRRSRSRRVPRPAGRGCGRKRRSGQPA